MGAKFHKKPNFFVEIVPKRFQDAPRRSQDAPKMRQDAPRRPKDGPRPSRGRARTAPSRRQTPQDGSKMVPRGARDGSRRQQIRQKKRSKSDPKHNPLQTEFLERFWADDGKRLCDLIAARNVVLRLAPQDNSVGRGRSGGGSRPIASGGTAGG